MELLSTATLIVVVLNLIAFAFTYGKLSQKVDDACKRLESLERRITNGGK